MIVQILPKKANFGQIASSPRLFTPTCKYFYTDISVISVTFRNSDDAMMTTTKKMVMHHHILYSKYDLQFSIVNTTTLIKMVWG